MEILQVFIIAVVMGIDAVCVALGVSCGGGTRRSGIKMSLFFGLFQFIMPLLGAFLGYFLGKFFSGMDYVAAAILFVIAIKMFLEARNESCDCSTKDPTAGFGIIVLSLATSMDAFGIGIPLSTMQVNIVLASGIIGIVCASMTWLGFISGRFLSRWFSKAEYIGAVVLFLIGIKMIIW